MAHGASRPIRMQHFLDVSLVHGEDLNRSAKGQYVSGTPVTADDGTPDARLEMLRRGMWWNDAYVAAKWGCSPTAPRNRQTWVSTCRFTSPFNDSSQQIFHWHLDEEARAYIQTGVRSNTSEIAWHP